MEEVRNLELRPLAYYLSQPYPKDHIKTWAAERRIPVPSTPGEKNFMTAFLKPLAAYLEVQDPTIVNYFKDHYGMKSRDKLVTVLGRANRAGDLPALLNGLDIHLKELADHHQPAEEPTQSGDPPPKRSRSSSAPPKRVRMTQSEPLDLDARLPKFAALKEMSLHVLKEALGENAPKSNEPKIKLIKKLVFQCLGTPSTARPRPPLNDCWERPTSQH